MPAACIGDDPRQIIDPVVVNLVRQSNASTAAALTIDASKLKQAEEAHVENPYFVEFRKFQERDAGHIQKLNTRLSRAIIDHFVTARRSVWTEKDFREPFMAVAKNPRSATKGITLLGSFMTERWTSKEQQHVLLTMVQNNVSLTKSFAAYLASLPPESQCQHIWMLQDITAVLNDVGDAEVAAIRAAHERGEQSETLTAFSYGTYVLFGLMERRVGYTYAGKLYEILNQVRERPPHSVGGKQAAVTG